MIKILTESIVDGEQWYTVQCQYEPACWIRDEHNEQKYKLWFEDIDIHQRVNYVQVFDVHEKFYTMLSLRWA